jgi:hypothetical protein
LICGKAWNNKQSLYAHCKVHKKGELARTTIKMEAEQLEKLKEICKKHNTTTCHLFKALGEAVIAGDKQGIINIASPNPCIINVSHNFFGKPRSAYKIGMEILDEYRSIKRFKDKKTGKFYTLELKSLEEKLRCARNQIYWNPYKRKYEEDEKLAS